MELEAKFLRGESGQDPDFKSALCVISADSLVLLLQTALCLLESVYFISLHHVWKTHADL